MPQKLETVLKHVEEISNKLAMIRLLTKDGIWIISLEKLTIIA